MKLIKLPHPRELHVNTDDISHIVSAGTGRTLVTLGEGTTFSIDMDITQLVDLICSEDS